MALSQEQGILHALTPSVQRFLLLLLVLPISHVQTGESPALGLTNTCLILQHRTVANIYPPYGLYPIFRAFHNRTVLLFQVPYGMSVAEYITYRTVLSSVHSNDICPVNRTGFQRNRTVFPISSTVRSFKRVTLRYFLTKPYGL